MKRFFGLTVALALVCTYVVVAQDTTGSASDESAQKAATTDGASDESSQKATTIIKRAADYVAGQKALSVRADILYRFVLGADRQEMSSVYTLAFKRPSTVAVSMENPDIALQVFSDGSELTVLIPSFSQYTVEKFDQIAVKNGENRPAFVVKRAGLDPITPLVDMLAEFAEPTPYAHLLEHLTSASYVGEESIGEVACDRVSFEHEDLKWDMWVRRGEKPQVVRLALDLSHLMADAEFLIAMDLSQWKIGDIGEETLAFAPSTDVRKVDFFSQPQPADFLVGKVAPEVTLDLLEGGKLDTVASRGKEIMILDFWASWCGPCRMAMPIIDRVADSLKDEGVRMYAVNIKEGASTIREYLSETGLDITVALDPEGVTSDLYKVGGIPQTVLIDRTGDVRFVHVGVPPAGEFEAVLREQLGAMIDESKKKAGA